MTTLITAKEFRQKNEVLFEEVVERLAKTINIVTSIPTWANRDTIEAWTKLPAEKDRLDKFLADRGWKLYYSDQRDGDMLKIDFLE